MFTEIDRLNDEFFKNDKTQIRALFVLLTFSILHFIIFTK